MRWNLWGGIPMVSGTGLGIHRSRVGGTLLDLGTHGSGLSWDHGALGNGWVLLWPQMSLFHHLCSQYRFPTPPPLPVCAGGGRISCTMAIFPLSPCRWTCHPLVSSPWQSHLWGWGCAWQGLLHHSGATKQLQVHLGHIGYKGRGGVAAAVTGFTGLRRDIFSLCFWLSGE